MNQGFKKEVKHNLENLMQYYDQEFPYNTTKRLQSILAKIQQQVSVEPEVMQKTADDKHLYWKSTVVQDDDLRYGDKPKKQYFRTICFDNQQTMIEPGIKLKADNLEIGTVVEIYLPK